MPSRPEDPINSRTLSGAELLAIAFGTGWIIVISLVLWTAPDEGRLNRVLTLSVVVVPALLAWTIAAVLRTARIMQTEAFHTQNAINGLRQTYLADQATQSDPDPAIQQRLNELTEATKKTETALATFASKRVVSRLIVPQPAPQAGGDQRTLALGTSAEDIAPPLNSADLIRALNFPDDENDAEGFAALRRALKDRTARQLVQASQDVLTLLSQDGIYMDDLRPDNSAADLWRRFAKGERGEAVTALGRIGDRSSLALAAGRMREDTIFRDTVHHFLRKYDQMLVLFEREATDRELLDLAETRTACAFMLMGRVTGTFD